MVFGQARATFQATTCTLLTPSRRFLICWRNPTHLSCGYKLIQLCKLPILQSSLLLILQRLLAQIHFKLVKLQFYWQTLTLFYKVLQKGDISSGFTGNFSSLFHEFIYNHFQFRFYSHRLLGT